jgi:hypothetical protein
MMSGTGGSIIIVSNVLYARMSGHLSRLYGLLGLERAV